MSAFLAHRSLCFTGNRTVDAHSVFCDGSAGFGFQWTCLRYASANANHSSYPDPNSYSKPYSDVGSNKDTYAPSNTYSDLGFDGDTYVPSYTPSNTYSDADSDSDTYLHSYTPSNTYSDVGSDGDRSDVHQPALESRPTSSKHIS